MLKKLIAVIALLAICGASISGTAVVKTSTNSTVFARPFCQLGMQFMAASLAKGDTSNGSGGISLIQVLGKDGLPMPCVEDAR